MDFRAICGLKVSLDQHLLTLLECFIDHAG